MLHTVSVLSGSSAIDAKITARKCGNQCGLKLSHGARSTLEIKIARIEAGRQRNIDLVVKGVIGDDDARERIDGEAVPFWQPVWAAAI